MNEPVPAYCQAIGPSLTLTVPAKDSPVASVTVFGETPADPLQVHEGLPHLVDGGGDDEIVGRLHEVSLPQQPRPRDS